MPIDTCLSQGYVTMGNTVSCYISDPEGNQLEIYAMVEADPELENGGQYPLNFEQSVEDIVAQAKCLAAVAGR